MHTVWHGSVFDHGTPSSCHRPTAEDTWAENNIFSVAGIWCTFQVHHEQIGPGLCPQPEDVAGAIQHICATVGRVHLLHVRSMELAHAQVIPNMYNVCVMMRENG